MSSTENSQRPRYFDPAPFQRRTIAGDICIYGGTSGGVISAIEAAERGRRVILVESGAHLGGMTSGGLGMTDVGSQSLIHAIGGKAREFYRRVGRHYGVAEEWYFEPHVAEHVFESWLAESGVLLYRREFLHAVEMEATSAGRRIRSISTLSGLAVRADIFIDCSYEGDLLAKAGVSHTVGRESSSLYRESYNGMKIKDNRFECPVDPWRVAGDPASGLLPGIEGGGDYLEGLGDHRIQAYNFRLCLTNRPGLRIPFTKPVGYDPSEHELLRRYLKAGWRDIFRKFDPIRNGKTDTNNHGAVSTDFIGRNHAYPGENYEGRERIYQAHVTYQRGHFWCLANDPDVPSAIRDAMSEWGLAGDEFVRTGHWPHALYVRESRRMISDCVMTQHHCTGQQVVSDAVGLAAHGMDSHTCRRVVRNGMVTNEGDVQVHGLLPYGISYGALVPKQAECTNLLVPFCLSASHIAFGSIRMEPVLMVLGQSCAIAAEIALSEKRPVQAIPYDALRHELLNAGQILSWTESLVAGQH